MTKPTIKSTCTGNKFKTWLLAKELYTFSNFKEMVESRLKIPICKKYYGCKSKKKEIIVFET